MGGGGGGVKGGGGVVHHVVCWVLLLQDFNQHFKWRHLKTCISNTFFLKKYNVMLI